MHYALFLHIFFAIVSEHELILKHGFEAWHDCVYIGYLI
jgi:hypothetical protein